MFDTIAGRYDILNRVLSAGRDLVWRRKAVKLLPQLPAGAKVLDLCGGTGDFAAALRRDGRAPADMACLLGDFSRPMLALSVPKKLGTQAVVLDALHPPVKPSSLDVVLCGFGMRNLDDTAAGIQMVHEQLKPGGTFVTLEFFRPAGLFARFFYGVLAPLFIPFTGKALGSRRTAYEYLVQSVRRFRSAEEYAQLCRTYGFTNVRVRAYDCGIAHAVVATKG
jgi:demethylmenaquinone methyltransferase/2-methoxy-6-polyprenyl-1,4-benzoquinol methylase